jgi:phospholipid transport system transporter-binding protein
MNEKSEPQIESLGGGRFRITGALTFATGRDLLRTAGDQFNSSPRLEIDLSGVANADSAGLALLVEWYRQASRANRSVRFVGVPAQLRALAKISEIDRLLAFDGATTT